MSKEFLNPWTIEVNNTSIGFDVYLRILNHQTGEIRGIRLDVNKIAELIDEQEKEDEENE